MANLFRRSRTHGWTADAGAAADRDRCVAVATACHAAIAGRFAPRGLAPGAAGAVQRLFDRRSPNAALLPRPAVGDADGGTWPELAGGHDLEGPPELAYWRRGCSA